MQTFTEFRNGLNNGETFAVYLFEGEDAYFRERGLTLLKNKFVNEPDLNFVSLGSDCSLDELLGSLNGYPFLSPKRMTLLREYYPKAETFKKGLKDYIENMKKNIANDNNNIAILSDVSNDRSKYSVFKFQTRTKIY